jgi:hypothetical protein
MKEPPFTGQFFVSISFFSLPFPFSSFLFTIQNPSPPPANVPNKINEEALMALPFIGLLVGVDGHVPTHAVYAIYDSSVAGLRFVRGDGELVIPEQVCFTKTFKDGLQNLGSSQQISEEIRQRATRYYQLVKSNKHPYSAQAKIKSPTLSSVKAALTYISELHSVHCTALQGLPTSFLSQPGKVETVPCISVISSPKWNFDPNGFEAFPTEDYAADFEAKYQEFVHKYRCQLHPIKFQHTAFCLVGLEKAGLISFVQQGQNNQRYFVPHQTLSLLLTRKVPWHASKDWTVDCFLARFGKFESTFGGDNYAQYPNPVLWLEAEMEYEERLNRTKYPWKQQFNGKAIEESDVVVDWAFLKNVKWQTRGEFNQYPKPTTTKV